MIEAEGKFIEVQRQVLGRDLVIDPHDAAFQQRPDILDPVHVDIAVLHVGLGVIDRAMSKLRAIEPEVRGELISMNSGVALGVLADKLGQTPSGDTL